MARKPSIPLRFTENRKIDQILGLHIVGCCVSYRAPRVRAHCLTTKDIPFSKKEDPMDIINKIEQEQMKQDVTPFNVGDTVKVHCRVVEGGKERIQIYEGLVIARAGSSVNAAFTVRKISYGEGVERVFPIHTPRIAKIEVVTRGKVRRAKLHYLRSRVGKRALLVKVAR